MPSSSSSSISSASSSSSSSFADAASLWEAIYSLLNPVLSPITLNAGLATGDDVPTGLADIPYVRFQIDSNQEFEYESKDRGYDVYSVTFIVVNTTIANVSDTMRLIWSTLENNTLSIEYGEFVSMYRDTMMVEEDPELQQDGQAA